MCCRLTEERIGGTSTCWTPFFALIWAFILAAAALAAAAASIALTLGCEPTVDGLSLASRGIGLRVRRGSDSRVDGERERRSKRERGAGSPRSKRERGRESSDMARGPYGNQQYYSAVVVLFVAVAAVEKVRKARIRSSSRQAALSTHVTMNRPPDNGRARKV